jgi:hypothetical protein
MAHDLIGRLIGENNATGEGDRRRDRRSEEEREK